MTLEHFIEDSGLDASMVKGIVDGLGGWKEAQGSLSDIARYGADAGWAGFTYTGDTVDFFKAHKKAILALLQDMADQCGQGMLETVQGFNCIGKGYSLDEIGEAIYAGRGECAAIIKNALAWFALEETAYRFENMKERQ